MFFFADVGKFNLFLRPNDLLIAQGACERLVKLVVQLIYKPHKPVQQLLPENCQNFSPHVAVIDSNSRKYLLNCFTT